MNNTRSKRVAAMLQKNLGKTPKPFHSRVEPTLTNRFFNLFSNKQPLPTGTMKITKAGRLTNYNKRALGFLSERSHTVAMMNLRKLHSKRNKNRLSKALNKTRRKKQS